MSLLSLLHVPSYTSTILSFNDYTLPPGVAASGLSLVSDYGPDGKAAFPPHNLISPTDNVNWGSWSGSNSGNRTGAVFTLPASNSTYSSGMNAAFYTTQVNQTLCARGTFRADDAGNVGKRLSLRAANSTGFGESTSINITLTANNVTHTASHSCLTSVTNARYMMLGVAADQSTAFRLEQPQLFLAPMFPDRFVATTDNTSPYLGSIQECWGHFPTTGVKRGLRAKSGVDVVTYTTGVDALYDVKYTWLHTDQTTIKAEIVPQLAIGGVITLTPPVGDYILQVEIGGETPLGLDELTVDVIGCSNGGLNGADASAPIPFTVHGPEGEIIEARIRQSSTTIVDWHELGTVPSGGTLMAKSERAPRGATYTRDIRLKGLPSVVRSSLNTVEVADVIVMIGDSLQASWSSGDKADFITEFKTHNGNHNAYLVALASGGSKLIDTASTANTWLGITGGWANSASITHWHDFVLNPLAAAYQADGLKRGWEYTAIMYSGGQNDTNEVNTAEEIRVYELAVPFVWEIANEGAGRNVVLSLQELGSKRVDTSTFNDDAMQQARRSQTALVDAYTGGVRGAQTWDITTTDTIHPADYTTIAQRHARSIAAKLGYTTTTQYRGPVIESATKNTGTGVVTVQVRLNSLGGATTLLPATGMIGWRVSNNGVTQPLDTAAITVGTPVGDLVPVDLPCLAGYDLSGTVTVDFKRGGGLDMTTATTAGAINALRPSIGHDNGSIPLGIEWVDAMIAA